MRNGRGILPAVGALALIAALVIAFKVWDENHSRPVIIQNSGSPFSSFAQPPGRWTSTPDPEVTGP